MTPRERYIRTMHFQEVDHVPDEEFGWWEELFPIWHKQGLPREIDSNDKGDFFFGFDTKMGIPTHHGLIPHFEHRVLEEDDRHIIYIGGDGVKMMVGKDGEASIPKYLKFPVESREDWESFKHRLDPTDPQRFQWDVDEWAERLNASERPTVLGVGSLFGWIRNWMGFENCAMATIDDPDWVEEMVDYLADFIIATTEPWYGKVQIDNAHFWEDIAFNNGPMVSPAFFGRVVTPRYKRITDRLKEHGTDVVSLDCDGDITQLVPLWLEGGVNTMFPIEIRAGSDPAQMRAEYGHDVLLSGGVDKMALIAGKDAILADLKRLDPTVRDGGFIPHVDHRVPPDVTYENYLYYVREKRSWLGIPEPPSYEDRLAELRASDPEAAKRYEPKS
jgi:uroporphyrinogen-III decarboxylase